MCQPGLDYIAPDTPEIAANHNNNNKNMPVGPCRHRAWVVGKRPQGCFVGSLRNAPGGLWGAVLKPLGIFGRAFWELLGAPW
eukprot:923674-Pyramimonas_sp.AAC.1